MKNLAGRLQNVRLTTKLRATFAFMVLASSAMSFLGYHGASTLMDFNSNLYSHELSGVSAIKEAAIFQAKSTRVLGDVLLAFGDKDDIDDYKKTLDELQISVLENLNAAEAAFEDEGSRAEVRNVKAQLPKFQAAANAVVQAAIDGDISAEKSARIQANVMANKMNLAIAQACRRREDAAKKTREDDASLYTRLRVALLSLAILIAVVGAFSGVSITHLVTKQLGAMTAVLAAAAEGDLTQRMQGEREDELGMMGSALNQALESTRAALMEVHRTTLALTTASEELNSSANELDRGSKDQSEGIAGTSAALVKLTAGASKTAEDMRSASLLASGEPTGAAARGPAAVGSSVEPASAVAAMAEINAASSKIADIISAVDTIAFQTNLLALNAAVEAAHAGDEGRGFAVVASEVRSLAKRSADSANEIKVLIQDSMAKVDKGAHLVGKVTELIGGIATASAEQSAGVQQVSAAMSRMDQVTRNNSVQAAKLSRTAHSLTEHASQLQEMVSRFQLGGAEEAFA